MRKTQKQPTQPIFSNKEDIVSIQLVEALISIHAHDGLIRVKDTADVLLNEEREALISFSQKEDIKDTDLLEVVRISNKEIEVLVKRITKVGVTSRKITVKTDILNIIPKLGVKAIVEHVSFNEYKEIIPECSKRAWGFFTEFDKWYSEISLEQQKAFIELSKKKLLAGVSHRD